ncbi:MAG: DUF4836 family protein [Fluviicola sp.]|jgi:hypothetical protein|nr:DUF4836 family protein [Fluviicola sp.]
MKKIIVFTALVAFLFSCGSSGDRQTSEYVSAFLNGNNKVLLFGKADVKTVLDKADYKNVPKFGALIEDQIKTIEKGLDIKTPIFFAIEISSYTGEEKPNIYAFIDVNNQDSTLAELTKMGQDIQKSGDLSYFQDGDVTVGIEENLAILLVQPDLKDPKKAIEEAFEKANGDISEGKVNDILNKEGDIVFGFKIESAMNAENPAIAGLAKEKQEKLQALVKDCYSESVFKFEEGAVVIESKNYMSEELKNKMFLKSDANGSILKKLGHGTPKMGFAINIDMVKLQALMEEFSPGIIKSLGESLGGPAQMALMMGGDNALSSLLSGELGFVLIGEPKRDLSMVPDFNYYVGFGSKGKSLADLASAFLTKGTMKVDISNKGIMGATNPEFAGVGVLSVPQGCESFGKKGVTGFINLEGMDVNSFELEGAAKIINIVKYISFESDNETGRIVIKAKDGKGNILKQSVQFLLKELESSIAGLNM